MATELRADPPGDGPTMADRSRRTPEGETPPPEDEEIDLERFEEWQRGGLELIGEEVRKRGKRKKTRTQEKDRPQ